MDDTDEGPIRRTRPGPVVVVRARIAHLRITMPETPQDILDRNKSYARYPYQREAATSWAET